MAVKAKPVISYIHIKGLGKLEVIGIVTSITSHGTERVTVEQVEGKDRYRLYKNGESGLVEVTEQHDGIGARQPEKVRVMLEGPAGPIVKAHLTSRNIAY